MYVLYIELCIIILLCKTKFLYYVNKIKVFTNIKNYTHIY